MTNGNVNDELQGCLTARGVPIVPAKVVQVAVAVIKYEQAGVAKYLLATRHAHQHQGGKLEFVGGKIEPNESAKSALIREVREELGLDICQNLITKMGKIHHDYADKSVCLHIYQVLLNDVQYLDFKDKKVGLDAQAIGFYDLAFILSHKACFPSANAPILTWLTLPKQLVISHELAFFNEQTDWLDCYKKLPAGSTLLMRTLADAKTNAELMEQLSDGGDVQFVVSCQDAAVWSESVLAVRLTQNELMALDLAELSLPDYPVIVSCHDEASIFKANELAKIHPVMAILLSPVLPTLTHPDAPSLGWEEFARLSKLSFVPVVALGGVNAADLPKALAHGAVAVAGIRGFI